MMLDWSMSLRFAASVTVSAAVMKGVSWWRTEPTQRPPIGPFMTSPLLSTGTWTQLTAPTARSLLRLGGKALVCLSLLALSYVAYFALGAHRGAFVRSYAAVPTVILLGEALGTLVQLLLSPSGRLMPPHHRSPMAARSLAEFWGKRWDVWAQDWFRHEIFEPLRRRPGIATMAVFLASGLWHEAIINLPFSLWRNQLMMGSMLAYFGIQGLGVLLLRAARPPAWLDRLLAWAFVVGPMPLFTNEAVLRMIQLWP